MARQLPSNDLSVADGEINSFLRRKFAGASHKKNAMQMAHTLFLF
jgi:hypothetical protein